MPRGDRTGPMGMGRMTGRGAGYCAGEQTPGFANQMGFGCGFGRGRGFRRMFNATGMPGWARFGNQNSAGQNVESANEKNFLNNRAAFLEEELQQVKQRLSRLNKDDE